MRGSEKLRSYLSGFYPIGDAAWTAFTEKIQTKNLKVGEQYIRLGEPSEKIGFIDHGLIRAYYVTPGGSEYIHAFMAEGAPCVAYAAFLMGEPSTATFEALEETIIFELPISHFRALFDQFSEWNHIGRILVELEYIGKVRRIRNLMTMSAEQRFSSFTKTHGNLLPGLKQIHLAAYLGVTPESLSRLRAKQKRAQGSAGKV